MSESKWILQTARAHFCIGSSSCLTGIETHLRKNKTQEGKFITRIYSVSLNLKAAMHLRLRRDQRQGLFPLCISTLQTSET